MRHHDSFLNRQASHFVEPDGQALLEANSQIIGAIEIELPAEAFFPA